MELDLNCCYIKAVVYPYSVNGDGSKTAKIIKTSYQLPPYRLEQCQMHAGEEDHTRPGWSRGQDSPWKCQSE